MEAGRDRERALAAACAVAIEHRVSCDRAVVVHARSNVLVHLRPAPVVARVMSGTIALHDAPRRWLEREVSVLNFLAPWGLAVRQSSLIAPGPYYRGGLWLTFWEWLPASAGAGLECGAERLGRALRDLHGALSGFTGELGDLTDVQRDIERLCRQLRPAAALSLQAIDSLRRRLLELSGHVFAAPWRAQALHGDASLSNLLSAGGRLVWNDFEDAFRGPLHWDVAGYVVSLRAAGADSTFVTRVLDACGWADERELAPFIEAHALYGEIWQHYDAQRRCA